MPQSIFKRKTGYRFCFVQKTIVLRNFVDQRIRPELIPKQNYVLYFGRFSQEKGINTLLTVCRELSDISFHFAGSGPMEEEINKISNIKITFKKRSSCNGEGSGCVYSLFTW